MCSFPTVMTGISASVYTGCHQRIRRCLVFNEDKIYVPILLSKQENPYSEFQGCVLCNYCILRILTKFVEKVTSILLEMKIL